VQNNLSKLRLRIRGEDSTRKNFGGKLGQEDWEQSGNAVKTGPKRKLRVLWKGSETKGKSARGKNLGRGSYQQP